MPPSQDEFAARSCRLLRRLLPLALLAAGAALFFAVDGPRYLSLSSLAENRHRLLLMVGEWGSLAAFAYIVLYSALIALSVPGGFVLTIAGGVLFGTWIGGLCAVAGATLGATAIFLAVRAGCAGLARHAGPVAGRLEAGFRADAFSYLLVLRLVPLFPFWLVNLVPALAGVRLRTFVLATMLGIIPGTLAYAGLGCGLGDMVDAADPAIVFRPVLLLPALALAVLALLPVGYRRWRRRAGA